MAGTESTSLPLSADPRYRVLARKYRPSGFDALIGQEALVRTLSNAFSAGRIAHAYMLAGVRGVGKTTTARIIARALNCVGPDGSGGITISPCGVCDQCLAIGEDRHLDVVEMDAASHTGVDNIRELLDGVPYRPAMARFKVYIIDEVHMLSEKAFNALLKTLEEPPAHVKFIFATTEVRKVPVTVLSRCQRFDLRRIEAGALEGHLARVVDQEQVQATPAALRLLARAADGSVRDALSLLDQAIAHGAGIVEEGAVREMLGLADRAICFDLLDAVMQGDTAAALTILDEQHAAGADPVAVVEDLLELTHRLTRLKLAPPAAGAVANDGEHARAAAFAERLSVGVLARTWQMLLKGLGEMRMAPSPLHAGEMLIIRLVYASSLPTPAEALEALVSAPAKAVGRGVDGAPRAAPGVPSGNALVAAPPISNTAPGDRHDSRPSGPPLGRTGPPAASAAAAAEPATFPPAGEPEAAAVTSFPEVVDLARKNNEGLLFGHLMSSVHLVRFEPGRIELRLADHAPADIPQHLSRFLSNVTAGRWMVTVSREPGEPTLQEQQQAAKLASLREVADHPLVRAVLEVFPGAVVERVREAEAPAVADPDAEVEA